ncbi:MAG: hypothetical protein WD708_02015 [Kiritimatiellia bacterium]
MNPACQARHSADATSRGNAVFPVTSDCLSLLDDRVIDPLGEVTVEDLPDRGTESGWGISGATPLLEKLCRCAFFDLKSNLVENETGRYLAAGGRGKGWSGIIFPRDLAYAGLLGLNRIVPDWMEDCLRISRRARLAAGMRVDANHFHPDLPFIREEESAVRPEERFRTHTTARGTDDVLWLWWAADLFALHGDTRENQQWLYETGLRCFQEIYDHFYDPGTGLYRGQNSFVDIADNGYPSSFGRETVEAKRNCLMIRPASTNCLYYKGLSVMAEAAARLDKPDAGIWRHRADALKQAIREQLITPEGTVAYFMHEDGQLEPRQHCLASALAVSVEVVEGEEAVRALETYPVTWWGVPLLHPFYENGDCHHNNTAWPFCDAFFLRAREKAFGVDETVRELALLARTCRGGTFREYTNAFTKGPMGKEAQLWTLAPLLGRCHMRGWIRRE